MKSDYATLSEPDRAPGATRFAIEGILDESTEIMDEYKGEPALDAGLLAAAQAVEHLKYRAGYAGRKGSRTRQLGSRRVPF
jgi:ferritin-like metal-binding protein YciE